MNVRNTKITGNFSERLNSALLKEVNAPPLPSKTELDVHVGMGKKAAENVTWGQFRKAQNVRSQVVEFQSQVVTPEQAAAQHAQKAFGEQFSKLAGDKDKFHALMKEVYGDKYNVAAAENFRQRALQGDYSWLPKIEFKSDEVLRGGNGCYDDTDGVVFINERYLNDPERAAKVYSEEVGAYLDTKLNKVDTQGDEGEMFRKLLAGQKLSEAEKAAIRADDDRATIYVDGKAKQVEYSFFDDIGKAFKKVGGAIVDGAKAVGGAIVNGAKAVGGAIANGAKAVGGAIGNIAKGFWNGVKTVGGAIWGGVKAVGGAIWNGVKTVGGAIWKGVKTVGSTIWDGVKAVGGAIWKGVKWIAPRIWDGVTGLLTGALDTVIGAVRNIVEGLGTFAGGLGKILTGHFADGLKDLGLGLLKVFVQTPVDGILMMGGRAISAVQTLVGLEPPGRSLTAAEIAELRKVYGDSIDYSKVKIKEGNSGLFSLTGRSFTHGDTIYMSKSELPIKDHLDTLVHEMGHVWQHQHGGTDYMSEALWAQNFGEGYDFDKGIDEGKSWSELNPEQQAELMQQAYLSGFFDNPGSRFTYNGKDYTDFLNDAIRQVRNGQGAP